MKECCGTCTYHICMPLDEWVCDNEDSEAYALDTAYGDSCDCYESRDDE